MPEPTKPLNVFISYSHDSPEHKDWVRGFAERLVKDGVDVVLDQWEIGLGDDITKFMEENLTRADRVLVVCTPNYIKKANELRDGVGYERMIISADVSRELDKKKFIPVIREAAGEALPRFFGTRKSVDLRPDADFNENYRELIGALHNVQRYHRPPVGRSPFAPLVARKRNNLVRLRDLLTEQESALTAIWARSEIWQGASDSQMGVLRELFEETKNALPEKNIQFKDSNNREGLQAQIISVLSKINEALGDIGSHLGTPATPTTSSAPSPQQHSPDRRRVFVVHGRNEKIRQAMFAFLRAIGLDPIEWEEAIAMTGEGAPYTGQTIDAAFSNAQAAVILITGDDIACLKPEFISEHDDDTERKPTPQARPNVLFELGLAFGRKPDRTIIVAFGKTRPISDSIGRNVIRFSDTPDFRQKLAVRLRTAGCAVNTDSRSEWLSAKFDFPSIAPKLTNDVRFSRAFDTALETKGGEGKKEPNPLLSNGSNEFVVTSPDDFSVRIRRHEDGQIKGLILGIENHRLGAIGPYKLRILSARSFDSRHNQYRQNGNFKVFVGQTTKPTQASCTGENMWFIRKTDTSPHLQAGNSSGNEMEWPNADNSPIQRWLLKIDVSTQTIPAPDERLAPLRPVELELLVVWNPEKNEFFIDEEAKASA